MERIENREELRKKVVELGDLWELTLTEDGYDVDMMWFDKGGEDYMVFAEQAYRIAQLAEKENHHPRTLYGHDDDGSTYLRLVLFTNDCKGLSQKDFDLAHKINEIVNN